MALLGMGFAEKFIKSLSGSGGVDISIRPLIVAMGVLVFIFFLFSPGQTSNNLAILLFTAPLWIPFVLIYFAWSAWVDTRRAEYLLDQKYVLLELRLPRDTKKTPLAMETIFSNLNIGSGESNWYKKYWRGSVRPWWSVEIASIGGQVRFFVWTREGLRRGLESYFYAQYPGIEVIEAMDYSRLVDPSASDQGMFAAEFALTNPDPYPIKTYIDYGLDKPGTKPEEQIDPLAQVIELLGSLGPKEQLWLQIIFRMTKKEKYGDRDWKDEAHEEIAKIQKKTVRKGTSFDPTTGAKRETEGFPNPTKGQSDTINAIEKNIAKPGFDVGIRLIYSAPKEHYAGATVPHALTMMKVFSSNSYNGFKPAGRYDTKFGDYPWEDRRGTRKQREHERALEFYRRRAYFYDPYVGPWMVLSSEELATIYHVPSSTVQTPSLPRIQSATSSAPSNLPT